jgi:predicted RNA binding protein YcfA (HicA-like mRNA interferase family)
MGGTFDRDLKRLLTAAGRSFRRQAKGSHELWTHPGRSKPVTVPGGVVSRHTANAVLEQAGLKKAL